MKPMRCGSPTARLQPGGGCLEPRHRPGAALRQEGEGRHGLDQHLRLYRCAVAVGRRARFGLGREHGTAAIENFTEPKAVWMNLNV